MATIVLQAGHVFRKRGSTGTRSYKGRPTEQEFAWDVANAAAEKVRALGHSSRVILADPPTDKHYAGDAFFAIHCDGSTHPNARGASVGFRNAEGRTIAHAWKQAYHALGWSGFRPDNYTASLQGYYGCREALAEGNRYACIIECGFLTSPQDEERLTNGGVERAAQAIADAVAEIFGTPTPTPPASQEDDDMQAERLLAAYDAVRGTGAGKAYYDARSKDPKGWRYWLEEMAKAFRKKGMAGVADVADFAIGVLAHEAGL